MSKINKNKNFLSFIPVRNEKYPFSVNNDIVTLKITRKGFFDKIAQKFFKILKNNDFVKFAEPVIRF